MINEAIPRISHEPDAMSRNDPPPCSAEEFVETGKKEKENTLCRSREFDEKSYQR
jgi:hypothetical protein